MGTPLSDTEIDLALKQLANWRREQAMIVRDIKFPDFADAMVFVNKVAEAAEESNHHPDIHLSYNKLRLELTSHDSGGITQRDLKMARTIDALAARKT